MIRFTVVTIFSTFLALAQVNAQENKLVHIEDSLEQTLLQLVNEQSPISKIEINSEFLTSFKHALLLEGAFDHPFDRLKNIGKLKSPDNTFRIYTWNIPQANGTHLYFGFLQVKNSTNSITLFELTDKSNAFTDPLNEIATPSKWMGALYYEIVEQQLKGKKHYILLGFDFNNLFSSKKRIEPLTFDENGNPTFGARVLVAGNQTVSRVVFEYSARATMALRYDKASETIVFDHLSPSEPKYTGNFQFYGPDFSYDGFRFDKGLWHYVRDIDIRNQQRDKAAPVQKPADPPQPDFLYKPKK
ncbi:MAG: hypothetical protein JW783_12395 [Bacteroidales bacterium]|nr:hypothetical protein [Bacteroidales bacterium]MBN2748591.1 hypothetical protein [Bacteroidales bacterium]